MTGMSSMNGFLSVTGDLLDKEQIRQMKQYNHHGEIDTHFHSVHVAWYVYNLCLRLGFRAEKTSVITRTSLLHDLYLYNWYTDKHSEYHAFYHPKEAVKNIEKYNIMEMNEMQKDMILRHMFPLGRIPNSTGGWILTLCDKHCANLEITGHSDAFRQIYDEINRRIDTDA